MAGQRCNLHRINAGTAMFRMRNGMKANALAGAIGFPGIPILEMRMAGAVRPGRATAGPGLL
jgi:hypothetical protein